MNLLEQIRNTAQQPLETAEALPFASYRDVEVFAAEQRQLFSRGWVFICFEADLPKPGDYHTVKIADEPVVIMRGQDGELRALSNVCRHRGAILLKEGGNTKSLVCPFHAWTYSDKGALKGTPFTGDVKIDKQKHCLPQFKLESWFGLVFFSLNNDAPPLAERFKGLEKYFSQYQIDTYKNAFGINTQHWQANWKLAMENFVEGYHFFAVHPETVEQAAKTKDCFYLEGHADWSVTGGAIATNQYKGSYLSICMPPNFVMNLYEGHLEWARVLPVSPTLTEISTGAVALYPHKASEEEIAINEQLFAEDKDICERVQEGVSSQRSKGGKLVELEGAVVNFHQYLAKYMFRQ